jgi:hypothetical protein
METLLHVSALEGSTDTSYDPGQQTPLVEKKKRY